MIAVTLLHTLVWSARGARVEAEFQAHSTTDLDEDE